MSHKKTVVAAILALPCSSVVRFVRRSPTTPNALDVVPDKMPLDVPYGAPISLEGAQAVISASVEQAKKRNWKMIVAVVDPGGNLVALDRMDGAQPASIRIAERKACARDFPPRNPKSGRTLSSSTISAIR